MKQERYDRLMWHQQAISEEPARGARWQDHRGDLSMRLIGEGAIARSHWDAPEIDGSVYPKWRHRP